MAVRRLGVELLPLALVALAGAIVQVAAAHNTISDLVATTILGQCTWLALGMALAVASVANEHRAHAPRAIRLAVQRPGLCWIGAAAAFAAMTALLHPGGRLGIARAVATEQPIAKTLAAIALGVALQVLLLAPAIFGQGAGGLPRRVLALAPLAWLGLISYGMYLWHLTITELLGLRGDPAHFSAGGLNLATKIPHGTTLILFVLSLGLTTAIAAVSYYAVELPFLRRKEG
jgi:peptidoglycan/LPS O-acetylase OafA/YrhL